MEINQINVAADTHFLKIAELMEIHCIKHLMVGVEFETVWMLQLGFLAFIIQYVF